MSYLLLVCYTAVGCSWKQSAACCDACVVQVNLATLVSRAPLDSRAQLDSKVSRDDPASPAGLVQEVGQVELVLLANLDYPVLLEMQVRIHCGYFSN